jgi:hypothetical protein
MTSCQKLKGVRRNEKIPDHFASFFQQGRPHCLAASHTVPPETPLLNIFAMDHEDGVTRESALNRAAQVRERRNGGIP